MALVWGAIGVFKNPTSHRPVDYNPTVAAEAVLLADMLLRMLDDAAPLWPLGSRHGGGPAVTASLKRPTRNSSADKPLASCSPWWHHAARVLEQAFGCVFPRPSPGARHTVVSHVRRARGPCPKDLAES